jgi:NAD(P)-dependent dehydrogenase (short-subunit alcohol dehydrogenase family)
MRTILIIGGSSDIGLNLIDRYLTQGDKVIATYRNNLTLMPLNIANYIQRFSVYDYLLKTETYWDTVIFLNATTKPIGPFMDIDVNQWERSILENSLIPCEFLQRLYLVRNKERTCNVCFFGGGGVNSTFDNYSAYTLSKVILMKMCELLDSEYEDLNPFLIGPSYTETKIHQETLNTCEVSSKEYKNVKKYLNSGKGTSMEDIYACIEYCCKAGKKVVGGRNIAVRHDKWREKDFTKKLKDNKELLKLRRFINYEK